MNPAEFVTAIEAAVAQAAVDDVLSLLNSPPGRRPSESLMKLSEFYKGLSSGEQAMIADVVKLSVDESVFGFLCVLEGVRAIENGPGKGELVLSYEGDVSAHINRGMDLHDLYNMRQSE